MGFEREGVLQLAGNAVLARQEFGGLAHIHAANGVSQAELQPDSRLEIRRPERRD